MGSSKTDSPLLQMKTTLWEAWAVFLILCLELYLHLNPVFKRQIIVRNQIMISIIKIFLMKPMNKMNTKLYKNRRKDQEMAEIAALIKKATNYTNIVV